jgi:hypothetical protein
MSRVPVPTDPTTLLRTLDPEQIARRLDELDAEAKALRVLLRAVRARKQAQRRRLVKGAGNVH